MPPDNEEPLPADEEALLRQFALLLAGGELIESDEATAALRAWLGQEAPPRPEDFLSNPNHVDAEGWTPLMHACAEGDIRVAALLLDAGADPQYMPPDGMDSPLTASVDSGNLDLVELLLARGATVEVTGKPWHASLMLQRLVPASHSDTRREALFRRLFEATPSVRGESAAGLLSTAVSYGNFALLDWMLDQGATMHRNVYDVTVRLLRQDRDIAGEEALRTREKRIIAPASPEALALLKACYEGRTDDVRQLVERDGIAATTDGQGVTPLYIASSRGHADIVRFLLERGAVEQINYPTPGSYRTALCDAAFWGYTEIVGVLLAAGAQTNAPDNHRRTPLTWAAMRGHAEVVTRLLDAGADPNHRGEEDTTPLIAAVSQKQAVTVALLVRGGADLNARCTDGITALSLAENAGFTEIAAFLHASGATVTRSINDPATS